MTEPVCAWPTVKRSLIAILRGIRPDEVESIVEAADRQRLRADRGAAEFARPFASIERLSRRFGKDCLIGAGTVPERRRLRAGRRCRRTPDVRDRALAPVRAYTRPDQLIPWTENTVISNITRTSPAFA